MLPSTHKSLVKDRGEPDTAESSFAMYRDGVFEQYNTLPNDFLLEKIAYDRGSDVYFKNCLHVKKDYRWARSTRTVNFPIHYGPSNTMYFTYPWGTWAEDLTKSYPSFMSKFSIDYSTTLGDLESDAMPLNSDELEELLVAGLRPMIPRVEQFTERFNAVSFIYELRDLKSMFQVWSSGKSVVQNLSGLVLNYELGWKPFLGDCERIFDKVINLMSMVRKWNYDASKGTIWSRHANVSHLLPDYLPDAGSGEPLHESFYVWSGAGSAIYDPETGTYGDHAYRCISTKQQNDQFICHLAFKPRHVPMHHLENKVSLWYDALGVGDGASIVWNAIPFSFVVDWFVGVGDFLEQFEVDATKLRFDIVDFGYSLKRKTEASCRFQWEHTSSPGVALADDGAFTSNVTTYLRRRAHAPIWRAARFFEGGDLDTSMWKWHFPSWKQAWVGLNLIGANL